MRFFNRIRQQELIENKFSKYLLYAIGEIALVVLGIIIALQIDNWNESRMAFKEELQLYSKLLIDLNDENNGTNNRIINVKFYQDVHYQVYNETKGRAHYDSTVYYTTLQWIFPYHLVITEKYSNSLVTITNDKIRDLIKQYISSEKGTQDAYNEWNEFKVQQLRPFFSKYGIHNTEAAFNDRPYTFNSLMRRDIIDHSKLREQYGTTELDELLFNLRFKTSWIYHNLNQLKESNRELKLALKYELELHKVTSWQNQEKYTELINEAEILYDSAEYQNSAFKYKEAFEQIEASPIDRYNAACSYALAGDIESAYHHLFILANGPYKYSEYGFITTDPDLSFLYKDKRWNELTAIVKSNEEEAE